MMMMMMVMMMMMKMMMMMMMMVMMMVVMMMMKMMFIIMMKKQVVFWNDDDAFSHAGCAKSLFRYSGVLIFYSHHEHFSHGREMVVDLVVGGYRLSNTLSIWIYCILGYILIPLVDSSKTCGHSGCPNFFFLGGVEIVFLFVHLKLGLPVFLGEHSAPWC